MLRIRAIPTYRIYRLYDSQNSHPLPPALSELQLASTQSRIMVDDVCVFPHL